MRETALISRLALAVMLLSAALASTPSHAAGTAYAVDTAEVGEKGNCKVEGWSSWARNKDGLATLSPSCVVSGMPRTEFVLQATRGRGGDDWYTSVAPFVKFNLVPTSIGGVGFGFIAGQAFDAIKGETSSHFAYIPATLRLSEKVRININGGWLDDRTLNRHFATYGAGIDWLFMPKFSLTLEGFGQFTGQDLGWTTRPRFQSGVRYRPVDEFSVDLIYGRNINGEGSHWFTLSTAYRFSLF